MLKHDEKCMKIGDFVITKRGFWYTQEIGMIFLIVKIKNGNYYQSFDLLSEDGNHVKATFYDDKNRDDIFVVCCAK